MVKLKIYLQYPWMFPDSPYYKYLLDNPPEGVTYLNVDKQKGVILNKKIFWVSNKLKSIIRASLSFFKFAIPNAHNTKTNDEFDLIHCAHCLSSSDSNWVMDIEGLWQFYVGNKTKRVKKQVEHILFKDNCKKIMPWTNLVANEILNEYPKLKNKIEVVYPAIPDIKNIEKQLIIRKKKDTVTLLYIARYFYFKGGLYALELMKHLTEKYDFVKGIIVSDVPLDIKEKYKFNKNIKIYDLMPHKKLFKIYLDSDIFVYPGYSDSFGFAFLEAMSFGLPIVTFNKVGRSEIVQNNINGLLFGKLSNNEECSKFWSLTKLDKNDLILNEFIKKTELLIKDKDLRYKISKNNVKEIKNGKFSVKARNKQLLNIYVNALK